MTSLMIGIYGLYLIAVGVKGNSSELSSYLSQDAAGYVPWLVIVIVLLALYDVPELKGFSEAFAVLIILGFIVRENSTVVSQFETFYSWLTSASSTSNAAPAASP